MSKTRWVLLLLGSLSGCMEARAQDVVLVVHKNVQIAEITTGDLRAIFTGTKTRYADGSHAVPVTLKGGAAHEVFLKNHIGESPGDFRAQWRKAVFTGQGAMPKAFETESALIEYVAVTPGAVGYVSRILPEDLGKVKSLVALR